MSVYVDDFDAPYSRMLMCHMIADTSQELIEMAKKIEVNTKWIQKPGTWKEHFDICKSKKAIAIRNGAIEIGFREMSELRSQRGTNNCKINYEPKKRTVYYETSAKSENGQVRIPYNSKGN